MDIILRKCKQDGWLGLVEHNGKEAYRTGKHYESEYECLNRVNDWLDEQEER